MDVQFKAAAIKNTGDDGEFPGSFEVILSAPTKDRDGDTLLPGDWKQPLPERITFDADHAMSVAGTVGSGVPRIDEETGNLIVTGTYSSLPRAQEVRTLVNEGHINTTSVAFMTEPATDKDGKPSQVRELLNGAFVAIPSNREALVLSSKALKTGARNSQKDAALIQSMHDAAIGLGAECHATDKAAHTNVRDTVAANESESDTSGAANAPDPGADSAPGSGAKAAPVADADELEAMKTLAQARVRLIETIYGKE